MKLYEKNKKSIECQGKQYPVDFSFNAILEALDYLDDPVMDDADKLDLCAWRLLRSRIPKSDKGMVVNSVFKAIAPESSDPQGKQSMDLEQDREYIRAGFRQAYGINLEDEYGRMHWMEFLGLLESLPSDTKMAEIASIRVQPIPKRDKYNASQVDALIRAKRAVALKQKPGSGNFEDALKDLFQMLKSQAGR